MNSNRKTVGDSSTKADIVGTQLDAPEMLVEGGKLMILCLDILLSKVITQSFLNIRSLHSIVFGFSWPCLIGWVTIA